MAAVPPTCRRFVVGLGIALRCLCVYLRLEFGRLSKDDHAFVGDRHEAAVDSDTEIVFALTLHTHHGIVDELRHQRDVARQDADFSRGGAGEHERGLARPNLALYRNDVDVQLSHDYSLLSSPSSLASSPASSSSLSSPESSE